MCMNAQIEQWDDIRIAYTVAKLGTLSAAAEALDIHHSTVLRRINGLEAKLNTRLFFRHARGYEPTEAGNALLQVATNIHQQLDTLSGRLVGSDQQVEGALMITTVNSVMALFTPWFAEFQQLYPSIRLEVSLDSRRLRLDYGEAHIAIRPGAQPSEPDYIAQKLMSMPSGLYASDQYITRYGLPASVDEMVTHHRFISGDPKKPIPFIQWIEKNVPPENIVYRAYDVVNGIEAVSAGIGIGGVNHPVAKLTPSLTPVLGPWTDWQTDYWLVTHLMMHRTARVQAFCDFMKQKFSQL